MADVIRMPLLSDTMTEGKIAAWNKKVGDAVKSDESLADVETDKAVMEVIPYVEGTLLYVGVEAGQSAKVNDIIAIIGKPGEDISTYLNGQAAAPAAPSVQANIPAPETEKLAEVKLPADLTVIRMPLLSDTMKEGKIIAWNKQVGDAVKADDSLAGVETDKATMEVVGYAEGVLLYQGIPAGQSAKVNEVIAVVGKAGTDIQPYLTLLRAADSAVTEKSAAPASSSEKPTTVAAASVHKDLPSDQRLKISPLARTMAKEKGIDLQTLAGSGDNGRIIKRDIDAWKPAAGPSMINTVLPASQEGYTDIPLSQMRKIIAQKLSDSKNTAPHFYLKTTVATDALLTLRKQINELSPVKISVNDMMIKAVALSLRQHPEVNSSWMGDFIRQHQHIHIGSAIALPDGLIVPVIKFAAEKTIAQIATDAASLYEKARTKKIQPAEFSGNTFTISNLGMMDIDEFTAIINPPDACILAVGKSTATPVVEQGEVVLRSQMKLTLSCDHRVVDGAVGATFLKTLKGYLEQPLALLL